MYERILHKQLKPTCGEGGWIHYRVLTEQHYNDIKRLLQLKVNK